MALTHKLKVLAYITRQVAGVTQLLVFDHRDFPEAGIQVPAGTIEPNELPAVAAVREVREESGLELAEPAVCLGIFPWLRRDRNEQHQRHVFHFNAPASTPENWAHEVKGHGEDGGMVFRYFWLPVPAARDRLAAEQGAYLGDLPARPGGEP